MKIQRQRLVAFRNPMQLIGFVFLLVAVVAPSLVAAADDFKKDDFDFSKMGGKPCPNFRCTSGQTPVPKSRVKFQSSGCSAMGGNALMMNPGAGDVADEKPYESCCHEFHACYQICGVSKKVCDDAFKTCSEAKCLGKGEDCSQGANLSTMMLQLGGCQQFDQAQLQNCQCVDKEKAGEKREAAIRAFYKKNAPDAAAKAGELAKKTDNASKLAALFRKLLTKYPTAITIVEDPQQEMYRKMFEKVQDDKKGGGDGDADAEDANAEEEVQEL